MERVRATDRIRGTTGHGFGDPVSHISRNMGDFGCSPLSEFVEEHIQRSLGPARAGPHETAGVMVNNHNQVTVSPLVGDLIDPDPSQTIKTVDVGFDVCVDSGDNRSDRPPRHPKQLTGCTLGRSHREPRRHRVEVSGMTHAMSRPRNLSHGWSMG